jgi:hypothetical protein
MNIFYRFGFVAGVLFVVGAFMYFAPLWCCIPMSIPFCLNLYAYRFFSRGSKNAL